MKKKAQVTLNLEVKMDTKADTCVIMTPDLVHFPLPLTIPPRSNTLTGYGGSKIDNLGAVILSVSFSPLVCACQNFEGRIITISTGTDP